MIGEDPSGAEHQCTYTCAPAPAPAPAGTSAPAGKSAPAPAPVHQLAPVLACLAQTGCTEWAPAPLSAVSSQASCTQQRAFACCKWALRTLGLTKTLIPVQPLHGRPPGCRGWTSCLTCAWAWACALQGLDILLDMCMCISGAGYPA